MNRRSLVSILIFLALIAVGCGGDDEDEETTPATTRAAAQFETVDEGVLTVGSDIPFRPFEYREGGELTGFDVELMEEMAKRLGLEVKWVDTAFDTIFTQLAGGQFDAVASATTITPERERQVNFTEPYYRAQQALAVNTEETPDIGSVDDLGDGHSVAVQRGTTGEAWAEENLAPKGVQVRSFPEAPDTFTAVEGGNVTAVVFDEPAVAAEVDRRPRLELVETIDTDEEYGFPVDPDNPALLRALNRTLREMIDDGAYQRIYDRFFPDAPAGSVAEEGGTSS